MRHAGVRVTLIVDENALTGLHSEHGLSMLIESGDRRIIFDTGQKVFDHNVRSLGIDPGLADALVLSHGHYDHTGCIGSVAGFGGRTELYCHPASVTPRYGLDSGRPKAIGMPRGSIAAINSMDPCLVHWVTGPVSVADCAGLTGPVPRVSSFEDTGGSFYLDPGCKREDPIEDDLALWIETHDGLVVLCGCSHAGIVNTLSHVIRLGGGRRLRAVIGGFHLLHAGAERLSETMQALEGFSPDLVVPCHCTGAIAVSAMRSALGDRVVPGAAGMTFDF